MANTGFSPSMTLAGMDYIAPSADCVMPTEIRRKKLQAAANPLGDSERTTMGLAEGVVGVKSGGNTDQFVHRELVQISLQDCLACSGCVTTAETILVNAQSKAELQRVVGGTDARDVLVSISDQSAASLAAALHISVVDAFGVVSGFMREVCAARWVVDLGWAQEVSSRQTAEEYVRRVREAPDTLPLLVSACPGWVCYCEKQGGALLPHLCAVMSPQGIAGAFAKRKYGSGVYHVSIQPCFDRKLEAARDGTAIGDRSADDCVSCTDCVLSTQELLEWMREVDQTIPWRGALDSALEYAAPPAVETAKPEGVGAVDARARHASMEGSGGFYRYVMQYAAWELHGHALSLHDLHFEQKRNANHQVVTSPLWAEASGGAALPHTFCVAYGFQQIQNIVRGLKRRLPAVRQYTFIELMACPGGCLNGGGQVRHADRDHSETLASVHDRFHAFLDEKQDIDCGRKDGTNVKKARVERHDTVEGNRDHHVICDDPPFSVDAFYRAGQEGVHSPSSEGKSLGQLLWACTFHDRQKEFEEMLNEGNIHSLKW